MVSERLVSTPSLRLKLQKTKTSCLPHSECWLTRILAAVTDGLECTGDLSQLQAWTLVVNGHSHMQMFVDCPAPSSCRELWCYLWNTQLLSQSMHTNRLVTEFVAWRSQEWIQSQWKALEAANKSTVQLKCKTVRDWLVVHYTNGQLPDSKYASALALLFNRIICN